MQSDSEELESDSEEKKEEGGEETQMRAIFEDAGMTTEQVTFYLG